MPTDTKKIAAKMSRTGWTKVFDRFFDARLSDECAGQECTESDRVAKRAASIAKPNAMPTLATTVVSARSSDDRADESRHDEQSTTSSEKAASVQSSRQLDRTQLFAR